MQILSPYKTIPTLTCPRGHSYSALAALAEIAARFRRMG